MSSCTPLTSAPAPRESAAKCAPHPAAPVGRLSKIRRHHLTPIPVQQLCTYVQSCDQKRPFLLDRARPVFFSDKTEKKMGGASPLDKPPGGSQTTVAAVRRPIQSYSLEIPNPTEPATK